VIARGEESVRPEFVVAQNWFEELNHRVPTFVARSLGRLNAAIRWRL
jgi:hypothetical protein